MTYRPAASATAGPVVNQALRALRAYRHVREGAREDGVSWTALGGRSLLLFTAKDNNKFGRVDLPPGSLACGCVRSRVQAALEKGSRTRTKCAPMWHYLEGPRLFASKNSLPFLLFPFGAWPGWLPREVGGMCLQQLFLKIIHSLG